MMSHTQNSKNFNAELISVRDLSVNDVPLILNYWFHSPAGFIESLGVDMTKLPSEADMEKSLKEKLQANKLLPESKLNALAILYNGEAIGFHTINPVTEGDFGIFHAHIWNPSMRRRGVGMHSYPKACQVFMQRFNLERILFRTPVQNLGAIRVKEKLGIHCVGEEIVGFSIIKEGTLAKVFELRNSEMRRLL